jgi:hypothetical protein
MGPERAPFRPVGMGPKAALFRPLGMVPESALFRPLGMVPESALFRPLGMVPESARLGSRDRLFAPRFQACRGGVLGAVLGPRSGEHRSDRAL